MPPIRVLAGQLVVNPNTVARAYLELERAGVVTKRQGTGTYVSDNASQLTRRGKLKLLKQRADALVVEADHLGIGLTMCWRWVRESHESLHAGGWHEFPLAQFGFGGCFRHVIIAPFLGPGRRWTKCRSMCRAAACSGWSARTARAKPP